MLRPDGTPFWSFGVDCVAPGTDWRTIDPGNPSYSACRLFPDPGSWVESTLGRLRSWGFNTIGGWADVELLRKHGGPQALPYTVVLHLGQHDNAPWQDLFGASMRRAVDQAARDQIVPLLDDPNLIGYFTDNELGWWDDALFYKYLRLPKEAPGKRRLMMLLRSCYRQDWTELQRDWITPDASDFEDLAGSPLMFVRPGGSAMEVVDAWAATLAKRYYSLVERAVRKYDRTRLILGDRFIQYYSLAVARACAEHVDVVSTNLGADWNDGGLSRFFLEALHQETRKPILVTEFYMAAVENRSGNRNTGTAFPVVVTQAERAAAFAHNVREMASIPWVVGAHWFQFHDEPMNGRDDGEDFNMGLVDIHGEPYEGMVSAACGLDVETIHAAACSGQPRDELKVPPAPGRAFEPSLRHWPREAGFVTPRTYKGSFADLYVCRDERFLYLGLYAMDFADERLYEGARMPESERASWQVSFPGTALRPVEVRFMGKDQPPEADRPDADVIECEAVRRTVVLRLPVDGWPVRTECIRLRSVATTHSRAERMEWETDLRFPVGSASA